MTTLQPTENWQPLPVQAEICPCCTKKYIPTPKSMDKCIFCMTIDLRMR